MCTNRTYENISVILKTGSKSEMLLEIGVLKKI
jgi:hypothetical protein